MPPCKNSLKYPPHYRASLIVHTFINIQSLYFMAVNNYGDLIFFSFVKTCRSFYSLKINGKTVLKYLIAIFSVQMVNF